MAHTQQWLRPAIPKVRHSEGRSQILIFHVRRGPKRGRYAGPPFWPPRQPLSQPVTIYFEFNYCVSLCFNRMADLRNGGPKSQQLIIESHTNLSQNCLKGDQSTRRWPLHTASSRWHSRHWVPSTARDWTSSRSWAVAFPPPLATPENQPSYFKGSLF